MRHDEFLSRAVWLFISVGLSFKAWSEQPVSYSEVGVEFSGGGQERTELADVWYGYLGL